MKTETALPRTASPRYRHAFLLTSLLLVIVVRPFLVERVLGTRLIDALLLITLVAGAFAATAGRRGRMLLGVLAAFAVLARIVWMSDASMLYGFLSCCVAFYSVVTFLLMRSLFQCADRVTADTILCALSVYLILGLLWTMAYAFLESAAPGSFRFANEDVASDLRFERFLGFSFTTLTTLGYGNVAPATPQADAMTTLEAVAGQTYLAVVIARLVALQIVQVSTHQQPRT